METPFGKAVPLDDIDFLSGYDDSVDIAKELYAFFDQTRGHYDVEEAGQLFLFLLTLAHYGYLEEIDEQESLKSLLGSSKVNDLPYAEMFREIRADSSAIGNKDSTVVKQFSDQFKKLATTLSTKNFSRLFEAVLTKIFNAWTKSGGHNLLTNQIKWLMIDAAKIGPGTEVFNPFAGLGSFGLNLPPSASYLGQEISTYAYDLARLRAAAHGLDLPGKFEMEWGDTFLRWPTDKKFDLIISNPPFGIKLNRYSADVSSLRSAQNFLISEGVKLLKPKGKLVTLVSEDFLYRGGTEAATRRFLIENDLIETVFSIPQGMLIGTSVASAILVINKDKKSKGKIKFADPPVLDLGNDRGLVFVGNPIDDLNQFDDPNYAPEYSLNDALVDNDSIVNHNFNLAPKRYTLPDATGTPLSELLTPLKGSLLKGNYSGYLTTVKDLASEDEQDYSASFPTLSEDDMATGQYLLPRGTRKLDTFAALLIAVSGRKLKPSYFSPKVENRQKFPLYLSPQVKAFKFDRNQLEHDYLVHQLRSKLVKKQLEAYQTGTGIPRLNVDDFLRIKILLPSRQEQFLTMRALKEVNKKMEVLVKERNALAHGAKLERNTRFATLKHALGRPQQSILSAAKTIKGYLQYIGEGGDKLNNEYAEFFEQQRTVSDTLQGIIDDVDFISRLMDRGENGLQVDNYDLSSHSLTEVLKAVKALNGTGFKFKLKVRAEQTKDWDQLGVRINMQLLRVLLDNLLTNADKHGFAEVAPGNLVQITLSIIDYNLVVEVQNNGQPFPLKFGKQQFIQEFKTSSTDVGQGIGGHQVDQVAKRFDNPDWKLVTEANEIFPVTFIFKFPISETVATIDDDSKIHPHE